MKCRRRAKLFFATGSSSDREPEKTALTLNPPAQAERDWQAPTVPGDPSGPLLPPSPQFTFKGSDLRT